MIINFDDIQTSYTEVPQLTNKNYDNFEYSENMMMTIVESKLSERFHLIEENNTRLIVYNGYIVDYATFCLMMVWYLSGSLVYSQILCNDNRIQLLRSMNIRNDVNMKNYDERTLIHNLFVQFKFICTNKTYANELFFQLFSN